MNSDVINWPSATVQFKPDFQPAVRNPQQCLPSPRSPSDAPLATHLAVNYSACWRHLILSIPAQNFFGKNRRQRCRACSFVSISPVRNTSNIAGTPPASTTFEKNQNMPNIRKRGALRQASHAMGEVSRCRSLPRNSQANFMRDITKNSSISILSLRSAARNSDTTKSSPNDISPVGQSVFQKVVEQVTGAKGDRSTRRKQVPTFTP